MTRTRLLPLVAMPLLVSLLAACQTLVSEPLQISGGDMKPYGACRHEAGAYALPRDLIDIEIVRIVDPRPHRYEARTVATRRTADASRIYCLDFLWSALSNDRISIGRGTDGDGTSSLLLTRIASAFDDQSLVIADAVVNAAAAVVAGPRGGFLNKDKSEVVAGQFAFDPFDRAQMLRITEALAGLDHCVFLDPTNDPFVPAWHGSLCNAYAASAPSKDGDYPYHGLSVIRAEPPAAADALRGVLYKPLLTHKLVVMRRNHDPVGPSWKVFETKRVQMTNAAPAFMLEVNRSLFVNRTMNIGFTNGVLESVDIEKPSEAEALSGFVLRTVQVVVSIPVRALVFRKNEATNRKELIQAQAQLIATLEAYEQAVQSAAKQKADLAGSTPTNRFGATGPVEEFNGAGTDLSACVRAAAATTDDPLATCTALLQSRGLL